MKTATLWKRFHRKCIERATKGEVHLGIVDFQGEHVVDVVAQDDVLIAGGLVGHMNRRVHLVGVVQAIAVDAQRRRQLHRLQVQKKREISASQSRSAFLLR